MIWIIIAVVLVFLILADTLFILWCICRACSESDHRLDEISEEFVLRKDGEINE